MTLTPEQLDEARAREAIANLYGADHTPSALPSEAYTEVAIEAARLGRIGGNARPVDPGVLVMRRLLEAFYRADGSPLSSLEVKAGQWDHEASFKAAVSELRIICAEKGWELFKARAWAAARMKTDVIREQVLRGEHDDAGMVRVFLAGLKAGRAEREE